MSRRGWCRRTTRPRIQNDDHSLAFALDEMGVTFAVRDATGHMTLARGVMLVGAVALMGRAPARIDNRAFIFGGMAAMLGYSPGMDRRLVVAATLLRGTGLGMLLPSLGRVASSAAAPKVRPRRHHPVKLVTRLRKHDRHRGSPGRPMSASGVVE